MSWTLSACTVAQFPKEEPMLVRMPREHPAFAEFQAAGFPYAMLNGGEAAQALEQATGCCYGDWMPSDVKPLLASADWTKVEDVEQGERARRFLELSAKHQLGVTAN